MMSSQRRAASNACWRLPHLRAAAEGELHEQLVGVHAEVPGRDRLEARTVERDLERLVTEAVDVACRVEVPSDRVGPRLLDGRADAVDAGDLDDEKPHLP